MKTILYYFTGTGNSLAAARKIADLPGDCSLAPIASFREIPGDIIPEADRVGIVCPVYFAGLPVMVAAWAERLILSGTRYVFAVLTYGGGGGESALSQLDAILRKKSGRGLSAGYLVTMPGNYILMYEPPAGENLQKTLSAADARLREIRGEIAECRERPLPSSLIASLLHTLAYPRFIRSVHSRDQEFTVSDACTSCGICAAICPARNIRMAGKRPVWNHQCELCCGCIHLCPARAIQAGKKTIRRGRYRHPEISLQDLETPGAEQAEAGETTSSG